MPAATRRSWEVVQAPQDAKLAFQQILPAGGTNSTESSVSSGDLSSDSTPLPVLGFPTLSPYSKRWDPVAMERKFLNLFRGVEQVPLQNVQKTDLLMCCVIFLDSTVTIVEVDWGPQEPGVPIMDRLGWFLVESFFLSIYILDVTHRCYRQGRGYLMSWYSWLESAVIGTSIVDCWILPCLTGDGVKALRMVTFFRLARLARLLCLVRVLRMFRHLYLITKAFTHAVGCLLWIVLLIFIGVLLAATYATAAIGQSEDLGHIMMRGRSTAYYFGSVPRSMYTLFELMTLEDWHELGRPLITEDPALFLFVGGFLFVFPFGLANMTVAIVIEKTLSTFSQQEISDQDTLQKELRNKVTQLRRILQSEDVSGRGELEQDSFRCMLEKHAGLRTLFKDMGISPCEALDIFYLLDMEGAGRISIQSFLEGVSKIRGAKPSTWDILATHAGVRLLVRSAVAERGEEELLITPRTSMREGSPGSLAAPPPMPPPFRTSSCSPKCSMSSMTSNMSANLVEDAALAKIADMIKADEDAKSKLHTQVMQRLEALEKAVDRLRVVDVM